MTPEQKQEINTKLFKDPKFLESVKEGKYGEYEDNSEAIIYIDAMIAMFFSTPLKVDAVFFY